MKVPPKRKGNPGAYLVFMLRERSLNESPNEKEGKSLTLPGRSIIGSLNESPSEKEGKFSKGEEVDFLPCLNESPSEKEGKYVRGAATIFTSTKPQ